MFTCVPVHVVWVQSLYSTLLRQPSIYSQVQKHFVKNGGRVGLGWKSIRTETTKPTTPGDACYNAKLACWDIVERLRLGGGGRSLLSSPWTCKCDTNPHSKTCCIYIPASIFDQSSCPVAAASSLKLQSMMAIAELGDCSHNYTSAWMGHSLAVLWEQPRHILQNIGSKVWYDLSGLCQFWYIY